MPFVGESIDFDVTFRHSADGALFDPVAPQIAITEPDGTTTVATAAKIGANVGEFRRSVVMDAAGNWSWYPVTVDEDITPTAIAGLLVETPSPAEVLAAILAAMTAGTLTVQQIVDGVLDELLLGHGDPLTVGAAISLLFTIQSQLNGLGSVLLNAPDRTRLTGGRSIVIGVDYTGDDRLVFTTNSLRDLQAVGLTLALEYTDYEGQHHTFPVNLVTGTPGDWTISVPIPAATSETLTEYSGSAEMAVALSGVTKPRLGEPFIWKVTPNP